MDKIGIHFNVWVVVLSFALAATAAYSALNLISQVSSSAGKVRRFWLISGACVLGSGIWALHYVGILAMMENNVVLLIAASLITLLMLAVSSGASFLKEHVLERMAYQDSLTDLPNRHGLDRYFKNEFFGSESGAVFFVDLDRFKSINDTLGHDIGDMLLQEVAERLVRSIRDKGKVFRLGGDEFLIALPDCSPENAQLEAEHIMHELKQFYHIQGNELYVTASVGISLTPLHGTDRSALMKAADTALYTSKDSGKNKCSVFDQEANRHQLRRMSLEKDLRKAMARSEFMVVYQPKWDSYMNVMVGLEALLRWRHPEHGIVSPAEFIPIAEETGLIVPITYWMLHDVCSQNRAWHKEGIANVPVSINMSARMFEDGSLYDVVEEALICSELEPHFLELEITESIAMHNMKETVAQLSRLRMLGVRVSLDDFGTGFSSLGNLDEIPVNTLKIDQVFIRNSKMHSKKAIISNIIAIATHLNMEVVAEGVETPEQIELLKSLGCRVMQGYYYGRPMPVQELGEWFIANTAAS
ncbi:Cyclic di-GMP phosphodiesterase Gmr [compost metagenome]